MSTMLLQTPPIAFCSHEAGPTLVLDLATFRVMGILQYMAQEQWI